jgi:hypothetical protein
MFTGVIVLIWHPGSSGSQITMVLSFAILLGYGTIGFSLLRDSGSGSMAQEKVLATKGS